VGEKEGSREERRQKKGDRRKEIRERILGKRQEKRGKQTEKGNSKDDIFTNHRRIENQLKKVAYRSPVECS